MSRILTTHVGSLIRPPGLLDLFAARERGEEFDEAAYERALHSAVEDVVRRQIDAGVDVIDDGEMGKRTWITYLYERLGGLEPKMVPLDGARYLPPSRDRIAFPEYYAEHDLEQAKQVLEKMGSFESESEGAATGKVWAVTGPITYDRGPVDRDIANFKAALADVAPTDAFLPVVAPASVYWLENDHYGSDEEFVFAVADALHEEYAAIVEAGLMVQVDDAVLVHEADSILSLGGSFEDYRRWAELRIDALNHALRDLPEDRIRYHICWGSWHAPHAFDPRLADIIDLVYRVRARYYLIEQANAAHEHEWRVFEDAPLPEGKVLIPGVVTHHTTTVEHPQLVADRLVRLARIVGGENVMAGTDCGFAQGAFVSRVHPTVQWAKLEALAEGARLASRELWGSAAAV
ncbi:MAG: cobalamin-independent methionine synthase II family protein [Solirubrobacteraceae bacterium]